MNKNKALIITIVTLVAVIAAGGIFYHILGDGFRMDSLMTAPSQSTNSSDGSGPESTLPMAMDFTVMDSEGNQVRLSDFFGKPIVLNFWASWCGPCRREMPDFDKVYREMGDDVTFLLVNMTGGRETLEKAKAFIRDEGFQFPVYFDTEGQAGVAYAVTSLPTTYFIDAQGRLVAQARSMINEETIRKGIEMILPR